MGTVEGEKESTEDAAEGEKAGAPAAEEGYVDIKFIIVPEGFSHTRRLALDMPLEEAKVLIEQDLRIPVANMKLVFNTRGETMGRVVPGKVAGMLQVQLPVRLSPRWRLAVMTTGLLSDYAFERDRLNKVIPPSNSSCHAWHLGALTQPRKLRWSCRSCTWRSERHQTRT